MCYHGMVHEQIDLGTLNIWFLFKPRVSVNKGSNRPKYFTATWSDLAAAGKSIRSILQAWMPVDGLYKAREHTYWVYTVVFDVWFLCTSEHTLTLGRRTDRCGAVRSCWYGTANARTSSLEISTEKRCESRGISSQWSKLQRGHRFVRFSNLISLYERSPSSWEVLTR